MDFSWIEKNEKLNVIAKCMVVLPFALFSAFLLYLLPSKLYIILIVILILLIYVFVHDVYTKVMNQLPQITKFIGFINMDLNKLPVPNAINESDSDDSLGSTTDDDENEENTFKNKLRYNKRRNSNSSSNSNKSNSNNDVTKKQHDSRRYSRNNTTTTPNSSTPAVTDIINEIKNFNNNHSSNKSNIPVRQKNLVNNEKIDLK